MPKFKDVIGNTLGSHLLSTIWITIIGSFLIAWSVVVAAVLFIPGVLVGVVAVRTIRWLDSWGTGQPHRALIINGEYKVLNSDTGNG